MDGKGLTVYEPKTNTIKHFNKDLKTSIGGDYIQCITESDDGIIWIGTFANGLIKFNAKTGGYVKFAHDPKNPESISFNDIRSIVQDDSGNLWIGSWGGGLNYLQKATETFTSYRENKSDRTSISSDNVISLVKDESKLWLATFGGGMDCFDTKTREIVHYRYDDKNSKSISSDNILSILKDSKGNLWIGSSGGGINLFNLETLEFNRFMDYEDLRYQTVTAIIEDNFGNIWFSTKQGIYKYDYLSGKFTDFSNLAGEYHINAVFKDEQGLLYFGRNNGVVRFDPSSLKHENIQPDVKITNFKLFNKEIPIGDNQILTKSITYTDHITLKYNLNVITFEFAAIQFPFSSKSEYAIQMDPFDKDWRYIGKDRTATYTNLSPGKYTFKVKSKEMGSNWGDNFTSVEVEILKPFWLEWWAFVFYGILVILVFYIFRKYIVAWEQMKTNLQLERITHEKDIELYNLKQQFFTNISHEIRTPVTLILGAINRLGNVNDITKEKFQINPINNIKKNGNQLLRLVNELLDYRKLEHKEIKLNATKEDLVMFCKEIYLSFKEMALQKNIEFGFKTTATNIDLWFDKNQMEKVIYNLLSNAFKFTNKGGVVELSISEAENNVQIEIKDKGIGIASRQLSKIFNRFYQTKESHNINGKGFGLGLSISKDIINLHKGEIVVESKKGQGSIFKIILLKGKTHYRKDQLGGNEGNSELIQNYFTNEGPEEQKTKTLRVDESVKGSKEQTLLIVEDNKDIREYIVGLLANDFNIIEASHGKEALKFTYSQNPDLIISDVMMPIMDGMTLTRELKSNVRTSHIPILLLTARASFAHKIEGFDIGADDYITKPFNESLLRSRIKNVLRSRRLLHEKFWKKELIPISELQMNKMDQEFMNKLIGVIEAHMSSKDLNAEFICKELGMSHSVVYKKIKGLTSMTYVEFVRDFKLKTAKKLIADQSFSIKDACYHVGYSDRKYFSKLFKQHFGKIPSDFLNKK